jgi:hypothetical protein
MAKNSGGQSTPKSKPRSRAKQKLVYQFAHDFEAGCTPSGEQETLFVDEGELKATDYEAAKKEVARTAAASPDDFEGKEVRIIAVKGTFKIEAEKRIKVV